MMNMGDMSTMSGQATGAYTPAMPNQTTQYPGVQYPMMGQYPWMQSGCCQYPTLYSMGQYPMGQYPMMTYPGMQYPTMGMGQNPMDMMRMMCEGMKHHMQHMMDEMMKHHMEQHHMEQHHCKS